MLLPPVQINMLHPCQMFNASDEEKNEQYKRIQENENNAALACSLYRRSQVYGHIIQSYASSFFAIAYDQSPEERDAIATYLEYALDEETAQYILGEMKKYRR